MSSFFAMVTSHFNLECTQSMGRSFNFYFLNPSSDTEFISHNIYYYLVKFILTNQKDVEISKY